MRKNAHSHGSSAAIPVAGKKKVLESQRFSLDIMGRERFPYLALLRGKSAETGEMIGAVTGEELMKMSDTDILKQFLKETDSSITPTSDQLAWFERIMLAGDKEERQ